MSCFDTELAPDYNMARDLYLLRNVFPDDVARVARERGVTFPDDSVATNAVTDSATDRPAAG